MTVNAVTYGTWLGISSLSAGGGVAAIAGVDAVKGAVAAGKRSRKADESEGWKPGDLLRGVIFSAGEATKDGAIKRGKSYGNDWGVGAAHDTAQYAGENKSKLGGAAVGGGGFLIGLALGGPIGGVIGGVVANATTRKAIEGFEEREGGSKH